MSCWPVAAGVAGVCLAAARLENSDWVFAVWFFTLTAAGPMYFC